MQRLATTSFTNKLKNSLVNNENARFIYINNFEVEEQWSHSNIFKLPNISLGSSNVIVNRMEEMGLFLASERDFLILKDQVNTDYLTYLKEQGFKIPKLLTVKENNPSLNITESILNSKSTIEELKSLKGKDFYLMPFGTSSLEEELSELVGIPLATPPSIICQTVNSKIYSRSLNEIAHLNQIPGYNCETIKELIIGFEKLKHYLQKGKLVIKDAMGVSGKGLVVIDSEKKFDQYLNLIKRTYERNSSKLFKMVIERWLDKKFEINYQFIVSKDGDVIYNFEKESIVVNGVHHGHIMPSNLTLSQINQLKDTANIIGKYLHKSGYFGVVGVDALVDKENNVYPNLEINARFNMTTYQSLIQEKYLQGNKVALAKKTTIELMNKLEFQRVKSHLGKLLFKDAQGTGVMITNFATVNAAFQNKGSHFKGRLYYMIIEKDFNSLHQLEEELMDKLSEIERW
ncbi:ATP-grasp domain-containing protein [Virgibacillus pantothenticus]|uniref:preATP grasp domain-containing protein n=1 Tax=Virgibacillus pantothenticus TaxID=1473 RepID=UPI0009876DFA|nr:ATP-grasp domain-containing protein [Virgibacillus pantothenticus]GIP63141.1 phosphoribosylglycinamide formyltransferase 2 [Virgibacillus pantothenticus]